MQLRVIALSTLAAAVLTACGGGGSLSGSSAGGGQLDTGSTAYTYVDVDKSPLFNDQAMEYIKANQDDETVGSALLSLDPKQNSAPLAETGVVISVPPTGTIAAREGEKYQPTDRLPVADPQPLFDSASGSVPIQVLNWKEGSVKTTFDAFVAIDTKTESTVQVLQGKDWTAADGFGILSKYARNADYTDCIALLTAGKGSATVRFGGVYATGSDVDNPFASLFMQGGVRSPGLPVSGKATYTGKIMVGGSNWGNNTSYNPVGFSLAHIGETKGDVNLTADFANHTVTGEVSFSADENHFVGKYSVDANIYANAVVGKATGKFAIKAPSDGSVDLKKEGEESTALLNGAFYGDKAEVVAGYMMESKKQWAGVFGASTEGTKDLTINKRFQAGVLLAQKTEAKPATETTSEAAAGNSDNASGNSATASTSTTEESGNWVTGKYDPYQEVNFTGSTKSLEVGGMVIQVKPTKGKYGYKSTNMSFGVWPQTKDLKSDEMSDAEKKQAEINAAKNEELAKKGLGGLFVQGFLTPEANMPKTGKADYNGTWEFFASDDKGTYNSYAKKADLHLTVDFAAKSVSGTFYDREDIPALTLTGGKIDGVTWTAENQTISLANTKGEQDYGATQQMFKAADISIHGWFYGPQAQETGGYMYSDSTKAAGVFGAKQCEDNGCTKTDAATADASGK